MYTTGAFDDPNPVPHLINSVIYPALNTAAWQQVSTNVAAAPYLWNVYKSPGANNSIAKDWYIALGWDTATNTQMTISSPFEGWNSSTNVASNYMSGNVAMSALANGQSNTAQVGCVPCGLPNTSASNVAYYFANSQFGRCLSTSNCAYWLHTSVDEFIISTANNLNIGAGITWYAGMYDSFISPAIDIMPIAVINLSKASDEPYNFGGAYVGADDSGGRSAAIFLREPTNPAANLAASSSNFNGGVFAMLNMIGFALNEVTPESYSQKYFVSRGLLQGRVLGGAGTVGNRGMPRFLWYVSSLPQSPANSNPSPVSKGDIITFNDSGKIRTAVCIWSNCFGGGRPMNPGNVIIFMETV